VTFQPRRTDALSAHELYLFDTMGFLCIPGFLHGETVDACRAEIAQLPSRLMEGRGDKERFDELTSRSPRLNELAGSQSVRNCVEPLINQPYRIIESYALRREGNSVFYLHNGSSEILQYGGDHAVQRNMGFSHTFHDGKLFCMFVKILIYLSDVERDEDGPFCYLQGSHKANWPWFREPGATAEPPMLTTENFPSLACVPAKAGDALVLNEALLHGTLPKTSPGERVVMAFSYAPAFVADWKEIDKDSPDIMKMGHY
jgi:hypothetical protein